jgi:hypothetical protein
VPKGAIHWPTTITPNTKNQELLLNKHKRGKIGNMTFEPKPGQMGLFLPEIPTPSAVSAHAPDPRTADIASEQRGLSAREAAMWGGLEDPLSRVTPGITPSTIRWATLLHRMLIGSHSAINPSPPKGSKKTGAIDVAEIRAQHQAGRDAAARLEGDDGKVTLSEAISSGHVTLPEDVPIAAQSAATPPSEYPRSREDQPQLPRLYLDELLLKS